MAEKYYIAPGKAVALKRGMAAEGEVVTANDLIDPVPKKDAAELGPVEVKKLKAAAFKLLASSKKGILTTDKPVAPRAANEIELRPEPIEPEKEPEKKEPEKPIGGGAIKNK